MMDLGVMLCLQCLVFEKLLLTIGDFSEYFDTVNTSLGPPEVLRGVPVVGKGVHFFLVVKGLKDLQTFLFLAYSNVNNSL